MAKLKPVIEESFQSYAGAVLQSRALVDARDCLKPSARQIFYCLETDNFIHSKPFKKTLKAIGSAMRMYIHGDSSCEGVIMRAAQPFAMRYPLIEVEGSFGNLMESGNWSAPRYTSSRLSPLAEYLFADIKKDTIKEWKDNYDDTEQYPMVLTSKGYYNIVNGTFGIGIGAASSVPQFNLKEVNEALVKLLWNPDISFEEIYCAPDFATGAILLNEEEVKDSLKDGYGKACKLRAVIDYDSKEKCLIVSEIPYSVYTNTICKELEAILIGDENPGIDRFNDLTGESPLIKIYLKKNANPDRVLRYLYKNTSLQYHYGINMTMLENGRYPRVFTWKEVLQAHIDHEIEVYRRGFEYDVNKIEERLHIIAGLLICMARIEEVIQTIKGSTSTAAASKNLQEKFLLDGAQAKAVLDMKLSRLAHLEVQKLKDEQNKLEEERNKLIAILNDERLLKLEVEHGLTEVSKKFGDSRRTRIMNIEGEDDEPTEQKALQVSLTNMNNLLVSEISSLYTQTRGTVGTKFKLNKGEYVLSTTSGANTEIMLLLTNRGNCFNYPLKNLPIGEKIPVESLIKIQSDENVCALTSLDKKNSKKYIVFCTKNGIIKKSSLVEYNTNRKGSLKAIELAANDEICSVLFINEEKIGMLSAEGQFIVVETKDIRPLGRIAKGRIGMKLNVGDTLVAAAAIPEDVKEYVSITRDGYIKRSAANDITTTNLNTKGVKLHKIKEEKLIDFLPITNESSIVIVASKAQIKLNINEISLLSRGAVGTRSMKISEKDKIVGISKF